MAVACCVGCFQLDNVSYSFRSINRLLYWLKFYYFNRLMSLFYRQPGLFCPKHSPRMPIPECRPQQEQATKQSHPSSSHYMGNTFPYICHFWHIVHEVSVIYYSDGQTPWGSDGTLAFAEFKFRELLAWSNRLPSKLAQGQDHLHHVQILQYVSVAYSWHFMLLRRLLCLIFP